MAVCHNYIAVVGRIPSDDAESLYVFEQMTEEEARKAFSDAIYEDAYGDDKEALEYDRQSNIKQHGGDLGVFIEYVLASQSLIEIL